MPGDPRFSSVSGALMDGESVTLTGAASWVATTGETAFGIRTEPCSSAFSASRTAPTMLRPASIELPPRRDEAGQNHLHEPESYGLDDRCRRVRNGVPVNTFTDHTGPVEVGRSARSDAPS